jgi:uncharacterized protein (DUF362 family)
MKSHTGRREFIKAGLITSAAAMTGMSSALIGKSDVNAQEFPDVTIAHGNDPAILTRKAVEALGGMKRFVMPGNKVVIKPNMSFASKPEEGTNTHPAVVAEVARMCSEAGASRIAILDNVLQLPEDCLKLSQIPKYCGKIPNTLVANVQAKRMFKEVAIPKAKQVKSVEAIKDVVEADVLIAVPVGKSHSSAGLSLSMKGMMGLIYDRRCFHSRYDLHEAIVDLVSLLTPNLVVIDGTRILSTGGPRGPGKIIPLNLVIASTDMVAADSQMVVSGTWYGRKFKPQQVSHIKLAAERGLGRADLENLKVKNITT